MKKIIPHLERRRNLFSWWAKKRYRIWQMKQELLNIAFPWRRRR